MNQICFCLKAAVQIPLIWTWQRKSGEKSRVSLRDGLGAPSVRRHAYRQLILKLGEAATPVEKAVSTRINSWLRPDWQSIVGKTRLITSSKVSLSKLERLFPNTCSWPTKILKSWSVSAPSRNKPNKIRQSLNLPYRTCWRSNTWQIRRMITD